jgi:hypothetical protein
MPGSQIETFADILSEWHKAVREAEKRGVWRALARGGWLRACQEAVQRDDQGAFAAWLNLANLTHQEIVQFNGPEAAEMVRTYLHCGLGACCVRTSAQLRLLNAIAAEASSNVPLGFCHDLIQVLLGESPRLAGRSITLPVLLVDTARNEGVAAVLTLELISEGRGEFYPIPTLAFLRDTDFRQAEENARACVAGIALQQDHCDVRWWLQRRDGKAVVNLSGPSLGAAFALGIGKLFAGGQPESAQGNANATT